MSIQDSKHLTRTRVSEQTETSMTSAANRDFSEEHTIFFFNSRQNLLKAVCAFLPKGGAYLCPTFPNTDIPSHPNETRAQQR